MDHTQSPLTVYYRTIKYRLFPTRSQTTQLQATLETCRCLYNRFLSERKEAVEATGYAPGYYDQNKMLPGWKNDDTHLQTVYSQVLQDVCKRTDRTFQAFLARRYDGERVGYPRFKGVGRYDSFTYPQSGFKLQNASVQLSKIGEVRAVVHRQLLGKVKTCTILRQDDKWFVCFSCEIPRENRPANAKSIGIDVGLQKFATLSDGTSIPNPRFFRREEKSLAKAQRRLSIAPKDSVEYACRRKVVARIHEHIRNRRNDFCHQNSRHLVDSFGTIAVENLSIKNMQQNHCLAKSIADASWAKFRRYICYKAESAGCNYVEVNPSYTSQTCSRCGHRSPKPLSQRWHSCPQCGLLLDRDHNAALNIIALGLQSIGNQPVKTLA